jgi:hypothetical protein
VITCQKVSRRYGKEFKGAFAAAASGWGSGRPGRNRVTRGPTALSNACRRRSCTSIGASPFAGNTLPAGALVLGGLIVCADTGIESSTEPSVGCHDRRNLLCGGHGDERRECEGNAQYFGASASSCRVWCARCSRWKATSRADLAGVVVTSLADPVQHHPRILSAFEVLRDNRMPAPAVRAMQLIAWVGKGRVMRSAYARMWT